MSRKVEVDGGEDTGIKWNQNSSNLMRALIKRCSRRPGLTWEKQNKKNSQKIPFIVKMEKILRDIYFIYFF